MYYQLEKKFLVFVFFPGSEEDFNKELKSYNQGLIIKISETAYHQ